MERQIKWTPSERQRVAFDYLTDQVTNEVFYGGGAGGGKSYLGCCWLAFSCLKYAGIRCLMGRAVLKSLKESTLLSFFMVCKAWGLEAGSDYTYNQTTGVISFSNGSEVYLKDLFLYPSDPEFDSLGSTEYTIAFLDEVSQITEKAKNIVMSRLRFKLDENGLIPKMLMASNPSKNFAYREFYKQNLDGTMPDYKKFVPALVGDNPFISKYYEENLKKLDKNSKERLLYGNWEYDNDPNRLFEYDNMVDMFQRDVAEHQPKKRWLTVDVARFGDDQTVILFWKKLQIAGLKAIKKNSLFELRHIIENIVAVNQIPWSQVIIDEDGVGGGLVDELRGSGKAVKGFVNNSRQVETARKAYNFANLKTQCYFKLADYLQQGLIGVYPEIPVEHKDKMIEDLEQIKAKDPDRDGKLRIITKEEIKLSLGRSPDYSDALMMRMLGEIRAPLKPYISV